MELRGVDSDDNSLCIVCAASLIVTFLSRVFYAVASVGWGCVSH